MRLVRGQIGSFLLVTVAEDMIFLHLFRCVLGLGPRELLAAFQCVGVVSVAAKSVAYSWLNVCS